MFIELIFFGCSPEYCGSFSACCIVYLNASNTCIVCCAESQQSVVSIDEQLMADVEPDISQQTDSEPAVVQTSPVEYNISQSISPGSSVKPSMAAMSVEAMDVNFSCSYNTYVSEDEVYTDITSLRRPALFHQAASQLINNTTHDHETVCAVDGFGQGAAVCTDSNVSDTHDAVIAVDEVQGSRYHAGSINDNSGDLERNNTGSDDEFYSPNVGATVPTDEEVTTSFHDTVSPPVVALSGGEVVSNENDGADDDADTVHGDGEVGVISQVNEVSAGKNVTENNAEICQHVDDEQLPSNEVDVHEVSPSRLLLLKQLTSEVAAAGDISTTSAEPVASQCEDLNTEMMDVVASGSDVMISRQDTEAGPSDAAVAVEQDERQRAMDEAKSVAADIDTGVQQSTESPTSMFFLC